MALTARASVTAHVPLNCCLLLLMYISLSGERVNGAFWRLDFVFFVVILIIALTTLIHALYQTPFPCLSLSFSHTIFLSLLLSPPLSWMVMYAALCIES